MFALYIDSISNRTATSVDCQETTVPGSVTLLAKENAKQTDIKSYIKTSGGVIKNFYRYGNKEQYELSVPTGTEESIVSELSIKPGVERVSVTKSSCPELF